VGVDAAVYRRLEDLPLQRGDLRFVEVDPRTGQVDFENADLFQTWKDKVKVIEKRIGNMSHVDRLKAELSGVLGKSSSGSLLISKVLYSGTHSGDFIGREYLTPLKNEIALVRRVSERQISSELNSFLGDMEDLIAASTQNGNPIVFI